MTNPERSSQRWPVVAVVVVLHAAVAMVTWRDIATRHESQIRGPKMFWRAVSAINTLGSVAYWAWGRSAARAGVEELTSEKCWELLRRTSIGRLATVQPHHVGQEDGPDIFPVNYLVRDDALYFRSAPGSKLMDITEHPSVVFEIDGHRGNTHWSVVVHGRADRLGMDADIEESGVLDLEPFHPSDKWNYVRVTPESITGRRFRRHHLAAAID